MGQIISSAAKPKRCNANQLSQVPTPAAGEYILVSSDNSMNAVGQGNFDCYIVGDGTTAATALPLIKTYANDVDDEPTPGSEKLVKSGGVEQALTGMKIEIGENIPIPINYTSKFTTDNPSNYEIVKNIDGTIIVKHLTQWSGGVPVTVLNISEGIFKVNYRLLEGSAFLAVYADNAYIKSLSDGDTFDAVAGKTYTMTIGGVAAHSQVVIGNITVEKADNTLIQTVASLSSLNSEVLKIKNNISELEEDIYSYRAGNDITIRTGYSNVIINATNGNERDFESCTASDFIPVDADETYFISASMAWGNALYAIYDENKNFITARPGGSGSNIITITDEKVVMPQNAAYIRVCKWNATDEVGSVFDSVIHIQSNAFLPWIGKKWAAMGDSLTEKNRKTTLNYHDYVSEYTGITVVNLGIGGTGYARNTPFYTRINTIPEDSDVITIFGSGNDLGSGLPLGEIADDDNTTISGCINLVIDAIQTTFPLIPLGIITPTPWEGSEPSDQNGNSNMAIYSQRIVDICKRRGVPVLDLYNCSNLHPSNEAFRALAYSKDDGGGVHPDENGHKIIAPRFEAFLKTLLLN